MRTSVVIPCRNGASTVPDAVASVFAQSEPPAEVVVVDDASTDRSAEAAREAGARVIRNAERRNAGGARNVGMEATRGELVGFLDADAVAPKDWLARARRAFEGDASIVGVGGRIVNGRPGRWGELDYYLNHSEWIASGRPGAKASIPTMAIVYRRDAIGPVRFPETNTGEDTIFALAVTARTPCGRLWYDPEIAVVHRHERLDPKAFWEKQVACGRTIYETRRDHDRPGKSLVRFPALLFLFPHLWITVARMLRAGHVSKAVKLFPWLFTGEVARIKGFFEARAAA
jgi:glycosyltransferase involved in cell wall biosynthesis